MRDRAFCECISGERRGARRGARDAIQRASAPHLPGMSSGTSPFYTKKFLIMRPPEAAPCRLKDLFDHSGRTPGRQCQSPGLSPAPKSVFRRTLLQKDRLSKRLRRIQPLQFFSRRVGTSHKAHSALRTRPQVGNPGKQAAVDRPNNTDAQRSRLFFGLEGIGDTAPKEFGTLP